jgi:hypothetical protein
MIDTYKVTRVNHHGHYSTSLARCQEAEMPVVAAASGLPGLPTRKSAAREPERGHMGCCSSAAARMPSSNPSPQEEGQRTRQ